MDISGSIYDYDVDIASVYNLWFVHALVFQSPLVDRDTMETTIEVLKQGNIIPSHDHSVALIEGLPKQTHNICDNGANCKDRFTSVLEE